MRRRYQNGSLVRAGGNWIARWRKDGRPQKRILGKVCEMTRSEAQAELAEITTPLNEARINGCITFGEFFERDYLTLFRRRWKMSTIRTNEGRLRPHLLPVLGGRPLTSIRRQDLQDLLDEKARSLSYSVVNHLRWDLKQIFELAVSEGHLERNPAVFLFTPREAARPQTRRMTWEQVRLMFSVLELRESAISALALIAGMRPGEIFALEWQHVQDDHITVRQRIYQGIIDSPKTHNSIRDVAISDGIRELLEQWRKVCSTPNGWVFASENPESPLNRDNCLRRNIRPRLQAVSLGWVDFQVMLRTHSSLMRELDVDPKLVADQLGHTVDVNLNVYSRTSVKPRQDALHSFEQRLNVYSGSDSRDSSGVRIR